MAMSKQLQKIIKPALTRVFFGPEFFRSKYHSLSLFFLILVITPFTLAEGQHRLEMGAGFGGQSLNHYRGSKEIETVVLPFPVAIYKGDFLKLDEEDGLRGEFIANHKYEFNLSGDLELRSSTEDNELRQGMPELDTAMQLGPEFNLNLSGRDFKEGWALRIPIRLAFTVSSSPKHIGYTFNPKLTFKKPDLFYGWRFKSDIALLYATEKFHDYYYQIDTEYIRANRPEYDAKSGFSGAYLKAGILKRSSNWLYSVSLRYDYLGDTVFRHSPLVETDDYFSLSFGIAYMFYEKNWSD